MSFGHVSSAIPLGAVPETRYAAADYCRPAPAGKARPMMPIATSSLFA